MLKRYRRRFREEYLRQIEREAMAHTRCLNREASRLGIADQTLTVEVHGEVRARAYMKIGWHPQSQVFEKQRWGSFDVQVPVHTLQIDRWR